VWSVVDGNGEKLPSHGGEHAMLVWTPLIVVVTRVSPDMQAFVDQQDLLVDYARHALTQHAFSESCTHDQVIEHDGDSSGGAGGGSRHQRPHVSPRGIPRMTGECTVDLHETFGVS